MATVYRFRSWDVRNDCHQESQLWATLERIRRLGGEPFGEPVEVDDQFLGQRTGGDEVEGMLARDDSPYPPNSHRMR